MPETFQSRSRWDSLSFLFRYGRRRRAVWRYAGAGFWLTLAFTARWSADPWLGERLPLFAFTMATLVTTWRVGAGPAVAVLFSSMLLARYFFFSPRHVLNL